MSKVILFNGPPSSGKDTACKIAGRWLGMNRYRYLHYRFAQPLKDGVHAIFGMPDIATEHFAQTKEIPNPFMMGMTPRQAYIWMSEEVMKPKFGQSFFADIAANHIENFFKTQNADCVIVSDCGFQIEVDRLCERLGAHNVIVVQLHRNNCDYAKDSRGYVNSQGTTYMVANGDMETFRIEIERLVNDSVCDLSRI